MSAIVDSALWLIGPWVVIVALMGLGDPFLPRDAHLPIRRPIAAALTGLAVLMAAVPLWNLAFPVGLRSGAVTVALGVGLAVLTRARAQLSPRTLLGLAAAVVAAAALYRISSAVIPIRFLSDTVAYHLPHAEWLAREPMPLGTGNLQTRLGLNPGFMTLVAALRFEPLGQTHLFVTEVAIRALYVLVVLDVLRTAVTRGSEWQRAFTLALGAVSLPFFAINKSGTDGNVGFLLLSIVLIAVAVHGSTSVEHRSDGLVLLLMLVGLAVSFKLSSATAALLLMPLLLGRARIPTGVLVSRRGFPLIVLTVLAPVGWAVRSFAATGCVVFPVSATCIPVRWSVGGPAADVTASLVTAFARRETWSAGEVRLLDVSWVAAWVPTYLTSVPALVVLAAAPVAIIGHARTSVRESGRTKRTLYGFLAALASAPAVLVTLSVANLLGGQRFLGVNPAVVGVLEDYPNARAMLLLPAFGLLLLLAAAAVLPVRRGDEWVMLLREESGQVWALAPFLLASVLYWFVTAPAVRFLWAIHCTVAALLLARWIASLDLERFLRNSPKSVPVAGTVGALIAVLAMGAVQPVLPIEAPEAREVSTMTLPPSGQVVRVPEAADQCSTMFPCAPVPADGLSATRSGSRLIITAKSRNEIRLLRELDIIERR